MTGLTAQVFGLTDRGRIAPGCKADLTLFDARTIRDRADWAAPTEPAEGIAHVLVNGTTVWTDGQSTGARPGQAVRRA